MWLQTRCQGDGIIHSRHGQKALVLHKQGNQITILQTLKAQGASATTISSSTKSAHAPAATKNATTRNIRRRCATSAAQ